MTRWSTPSKRPHSRPHARSRRQFLATRAWSSARPRGVRNSSGPATFVPAMARSTTSGRITMPGPPPNGASSTVRCLSSREIANVHRSSRHRPVSQRLAGERMRRAAPETSPGTGSARSRSRRTLIVTFAPAVPTRRVEHDDEPPATSTTGTAARVKGTMTSPSASRSISSCRRRRNRAPRARGRRPAVGEPRLRARPDRRDRIPRPPARAARRAAR